MSKVYFPSEADQIDMSLWSFAEHAKELEGQFDKLSDEQRAALVRICKHIAEMEAYEPVR